LAKLLRDEPEQPGSGNAECDVTNEIVHEAEGPVAER
jgi:hypothetical protein